ncbi:putative peptidase S1, PA clan [Helianthus annuus]|nr:putative peptidase S1, PA clan [Helianthus annuus]
MYIYIFRVILADQTTYDAKVVGFDQDKDVAVLRIDAPKDKLRPILVGVSADLLVGQSVCYRKPCELLKWIWFGKLFRWGLRRCGHGVRDRSGWCRLLFTKTTTSRSLSSTLLGNLLGCKFTLCPVYCDCSTRVQIGMVAQPVSFAFGLYQFWVVGYLVYGASLCL